MTIRSIDTKYDGHLFRSRLEARWAVFFNALNIKYLYEPQGFDVDGRAYLPDFCLLLGKMVWAEVKPAVDSDPEGESRWRAFLNAQPEGTRGVLLTDMASGTMIITGGHWQQFLVIQKLGEQDDYQLCEDQCHMWLSCADGYHFDLQQLGSMTACGQCAAWPRDAPGKAPWDLDRRISVAYEKARSARFEGG